MQDETSKRKEMKAAANMAIKFGMDPRFSRLLEEMYMNDVETEPLPDEPKFDVLESHIPLFIQIASQLGYEATNVEGTIVTIA